MIKLNLTLKDISTIIFWVNLLPTIIASVVFYFILSELIGIFSYRNLFISILLLIGILMEIIYYLQIKFKDCLRKKKLWILSIGVNILFILFDILLFVIRGEGELKALYLLIILYPIGALCLSIKGLKMINLNEF